MTAIRRAWYLTQCAITVTTWSGLIGMPVLGGLWLLLATVPQLDRSAAVLDPNGPVTTILLLGVCALLGSLAGGLTLPHTNPR